MERSTENDSPYELVAKGFVSRGIKVVAFDMDQTIVTMHSRGRLTRDEQLQVFLNRISIDFVMLAPLLHSHGIKLCVATHSDTAEYSEERTKSTHIIGSDLVAEVLKHSTEMLQQATTGSLDFDFQENFFVVAYNPRARGAEGLEPMNAVKRVHIRRMCTYFCVEPKDVAIIDDDETVCADCREFCGLEEVYLVDPLVGFNIDLLSK